MIALHLVESGTARRCRRGGEVVRPVLGAPEVDLLVFGLGVVLEEDVAGARPGCRTPPVPLEDLLPLDLEHGVAQRAVVAAGQSRARLAIEWMVVLVAGVLRAAEERDAPCAPGRGSLSASMRAKRGLDLVLRGRAWAAVAPGRSSRARGAASSQPVHCSARFSGSALLRVDVLQGPRAGGVTLEGVALGGVTASSGSPRRSSAAAGRALGLLRCPAVVAEVARHRGCQREVRADHSRRALHRTRLLVLPRA